MVASKVLLEGRRAVGCVSPRIDRTSDLVVVVGILEKVWRLD